MTRRKLHGNNVRVYWSQHSDGRERETGEGERVFYSIVVETSE